MIAIHQSTGSKTAIPPDKLTIFKDIFITVLKNVLYPKWLFPRANSLFSTNKLLKSVSETQFSQFYQN